MQRTELEHVIRAAAGITGEKEFVIIGSQAILATFPNAPEALLVSNEADIFHLTNAEITDAIDGTIGELSSFHLTFSYYAHGVSEQTAVLPVGWKDRLVPVSNENTKGAIGWCLEPHDLAISKLVAGREKDREYLRVLLKHGLVNADILRERLAQTQISQDLVEVVVARLKRLIPSTIG